MQVRKMNGLIIQWTNSLVNLLAPIDILTKNDGYNDMPEKNEIHFDEADFESHALSTLDEEQIEFETHEK